MLVHFDALVVRVALAWEETGDADRHPVEKLDAETFLALTLPVDAVRMGVAKLARCPRDACLPKPPLWLLVVGLVAERCPGVLREQGH